MDAIGQHWTTFDNNGRPEIIIDQIDNNGKQ